MTSIACVLHIDRGSTSKAPNAYERACSHELERPELFRMRTKLAESLIPKRKNNLETQTRNLNCQSRLAKEIQAMKEGNR
jgi:hypothetical protein